MRKFMSSAKFKYATLAIVVIATIAIGLNQTRQVANSSNCPGLAPTTPTFGVWPISYTGAACKDYPLIDAKNQSSNDSRDSRYAQSASEHQAGIDAVAGDSVRILIYFHNGASDQVDRALTTAKNATISSQFDTSVGTDHTASATLSADNAASISSSNSKYGGNITIHTAAPTTLTYMPNTAFLCVRYQAALERGADMNQQCGFNSEDNAPQILIPISDSINNGSFNLGDLKACFPYSGFLMFSVKVNQASTPVATTTQLSVVKTVRNINSSNPNYYSTANGTNGDNFAYKVTVTNTGSVDAQNVVLKDAFPTSGLSFVSGDPAPSGINIGTLAAGASKTYNYTGKGIVDNGTFPNTVTVSANNAASVSATATVILTTTPPPAGSPSITLIKNVRNLTQNGSFAKTATAQNGEIVEYRITVKNVGNATAHAVYLNDTLPNGLVMTSGQASQNLGDFSSGQSQTVTLQAKVNVSSGTLVNTATAKGSDTNTASDTASVTVNTPVVQNLAITISKDVRDISQNTGFAKNLNVFNGDTVEYRLTIHNSGDTQLTNVKVSDDLPVGLNYLPSTLASTEGIASSLSNIKLSVFNSGDTFYVTFRATVNQNSGSITNNASVISDQASAGPVSATINIAPPTACSLIVTKQVKNLTQGTSNFSSSISANPGDRLAFQVQLQANNNNASNITLNDSIPGNFNYLAGSARYNNSGIGDQFTSTPMNLGSLSNGSASTLYYEGTVASSMPVGTTNITNTVNVSADNMGTCSSSATVSVTVNGGGGGSYYQIGISKLVRNITSGSSYQKSVNANGNDRVGFQITVTNQGNATLNNVNVTDLLPNGLTFASGTVRIDNSNSSDSLINNGLYIGDLSVNQSRTLTFEANVATNSSATLINTARATSSNTGSVQDTATVFISQVAGGNVNIVLSKRANNDTKNIDATLTPASKEDYITYTLTTQNTGNAPATSYIVSDDLSNVLSYAGMVDLNGAVLNGNVISWPAETIGAGQTSTHIFRVRVNYNLPARTGLSLVNTYGNTVTIQIQQGQVLGAILVAPTTGANALYAGFGFAALLTAGFWVMRKKIPAIRFR